MNNTALQLFNFEETPVRMVVKAGQPWAVASDVCRVLGIANSRDAVSSLDEDERNTVGISDGIQRGAGNPNLTVISESGLYALIFRSRKESARKFRRWVTGEVLPLLRQTGTYIMPGTNITLFEWLRSRGCDLEEALAFGKLARKAAREMGLRSRFEGEDVQYKMYDKTLLDWLWEQQIPTLPVVPKKHGLSSVYEKDREKLYACLAAEIKGDLPLVLKFEHLVNLCRRLRICREWVTPGGELSPAARSSLGKWLLAESFCTKYRIELVPRGSGRHRRFVFQQLGAE